MKLSFIKLVLGSEKSKKHFDTCTVVCLCNVDAQV